MLSVVRCRSHAVCPVGDALKGCGGADDHQGVVKRSKKQPSCATLKRRAKRIKSAKRRKAALRHLPARCTPAPKPVKAPLPQTSQPVVVPAKAAPAPAPAAPVVVAVPDPVAAVPPAAEVVPPAPQVGSNLPVAVESPIAVYGGPFGKRQAERLLWRAGFGPRPGQAEEVAALGLHDAVQ